MRTKLKKLLEYLDVEQLNKEIIEIEYNSYLKEIIGTDKITIQITGKTKKLTFAGLGVSESYNGKLDIVYKNKLGKLIVKPKLIKEFLDIK